ncbi:hypothetical protein ACWDG1_35855 [Streptomyces sp. NPDC001177]
MRGTAPVVTARGRLLAAMGSGWWPTCAVLHYAVVDGGQRRKLRVCVAVSRCTVSSERPAVKRIE